MKAIYIGEPSENNRVIRDVCNEMGVVLEFSKDLNVFDVDVIIVLLFVVFVFSVLVVVVFVVFILVSPFGFVFLLYIRLIFATSLQICAAVLFAGKAGARFVYQSTIRLYRRSALYAGKMVS